MPSALGEKKWVPEPSGAAGVRGRRVRVVGAADAASAPHPARGSACAAAAVVWGGSSVDAVYCSFKL